MAGGEAASRIQTGRKLNRHGDLATAGRTGGDPAEATPRDHRGRGVVDGRSRLGRAARGSRSFDLFSWLGRGVHAQGTGTADASSARGGCGNALGVRALRAAARAHGESALLR